MSIYHMSMSNVSRAHGSSSCATLSYISGQAVREDRTGQTYQYGRAERVVYTGTMIPDFAPAAFSDPAQLFNSIERFEQAENARTAKKICVALPREFDLQTSRQVIEDYIQRNFVAKGYCATYAIHYDKDGNNPHSHILIPNRQIARDGSWNAKRKMTYALDEKGNRVPLIDPKTGQQKVDSRGRKAWKRINAVANPLDDRQTLKQLRASWAEVCNARLQTEDHIDARSYADQGKEQIPTVHEGYAARAMAERGEVSERVELNKQIREANAELMRIAAARQTCYANLVILKQEQAEAARAAAKAAEEKRQQEGADALEKIQRLFDPDYDKHQKEAEERQRQEAAARAAEEKRQQEQRRQAAAEAERQQEDQRYEQYWNDRLGGLTWRELEQFCKTEYHDRYWGAMSEASKIWIARNTDKVKNYFVQRIADEKQKLQPWLREHPEPYKPEPQLGNKFSRLFVDHWYKTSDGTVYYDKNYDKYRSHQTDLRAAWECDYGHVRGALDRAEKNLQYCQQCIKEKSYGGLVYQIEQDQHGRREHTSLYEMIQGGARKLIETLKEFAPVRAMMHVVGRLAEIRGQERRKDLAQEREQQHQRSQGRGGYYR